MAEMFSFACRVTWAEWGESTINALTAGAAKSSYFLSVRESWPDTKFTDIRCRKVGPAHTSERFLHNARYRGMPDVRCGDKVKVGEHEGLIAGHNSSANFDITFLTGPWKGQTLNVHPSEVQLVPTDRRGSLE